MRGNPGRNDSESGAILTAPLEEAKSACHSCPQAANHQPHAMTVGNLFEKFDHTRRERFRCARAPEEQNQANKDKKNGEESHKSGY